MMNVDPQDLDNQGDQPSRQDLVELYRRTHRDFFAAQPMLSSTRNLLDSRPSHDTYYAFYDPDAVQSAERLFLGGGPKASRTQPAQESDLLTLIPDDSSSVDSSRAQVSRTRNSAKVEPEPAYTFVREIKRNIATDDREVLHALPVFEEPIKCVRFDPVEYEDEFGFLEYSLPLDRPRLNTILFEFLRRVHYAYPDLSLDNNPEILSFLPHDVPEILLLPSSYELLPFPNPNPSTDLRLYGNPGVPLESARWLRGGKIGEHWTEVNRTAERTLCPMAACAEYDCETHSAVLEVDQAVNPRANGPPSTTKDLLLLRPKLKACSTLCYVKEREKTLLAEMAIPSGSNWPNSDLDLLMTVLTSAPTILPCEMVDLFLSDQGEQRYSCREIFHRRCSVLNITPAREPTADLRFKGHKPQAQKEGFDLSNRSMRSTRPCNHRGACGAGNKACSCLKHRVHCDKACACPPTCNRRFGVHPKNPRGGCVCSSLNVLCKDNKACECVKDARECDPNLCRSCGADDPNKTTCCNVSLQRGRGKKTLIKPTTWGNGLFMGEPVRAGDFIVEYVGELVSHEEVGARGKIYEQIQRNYVFDLNASLCIDAFSKGNAARFINHPEGSTDAERAENSNCHPKVLHVLGEHRIGIYAKEAIPAGRELLFDYGEDFQLPSQKNHSSGTTSTQNSRAGKFARKGRGSRPEP